MHFTKTLWIGIIIISCVRKPAAPEVKRFTRSEQKRRRIPKGCGLSSKQVAQIQPPNHHTHHLGLKAQTQSSSGRTNQLETLPTSPLPAHCIPECDLQNLMYSLCDSDEVCVHSSHWFKLNLPSSCPSERDRNGLSVNSGLFLLCVLMSRQRMEAPSATLLHKCT